MSGPAGAEPGADRSSDAEPIRRIVLGEGVTMTIRDAELAVVVVVEGIADATVATLVADELCGLRADARMVLDLTDAVLVAPSALCDLIDEVDAAGDDPDRVCIVCERLSTQVLLRRYGATEQAAVFGSVEDALQAALLHEEGYGDGWRPGPTHDVGSERTLPGGR